MFKYFCEVLHLKCASWNYTAAGHGKSAADAIDGTVKRMCDRYVRFSNSILCAEDIVNLLNNSNYRINTFLITEDNIKNIETLVPEKLESIKGTIKVHQIVWCSSHPLIKIYLFIFFYFTIVSNNNSNNKSNNVCDKSANTPYTLVSSLKIGD